MLECNSGMKLMKRGGNEVMRKYKCAVCGYIYNEAAGIPGKGIAPETSWDDVPGNFLCPVCKAPKSMFKLVD